MSFAEFNTVPSHAGLPSRIALALAHAAVDSHVQSQLFSSDSTVVVEDHVQKLITESQAAWNEFINYPFPQNLAKGTAALNGFRHYMIQDASYLEYYYRANAEVVSRTGTFKEVSEFAAKFAKSLGYVTAARSDCTEKLGVPAEVVEQEAQSQALKNSIDLYSGIVRNGDWLDIHIILLPCVLGYNVIASKLLSDPDTVRNTVYFPLWVQAMAGGSSAATYRTFINNSIDKLSKTEKDKRWPGWVKNFTAACGTEKGFFGLGNTQPFPAYQIVSNRTYKIRSYLKGNPYLTANGALITTELIDPGDHAKWILTNSGNGYTIKNGGNFLGASIGDVQPSHQVHVSTQEQPWSINPAGATDKDGKKLYQLLVPNGLQWVLDAGSPPKVFVGNNSQISSQFWLLEEVKN